MSLLLKIIGGFWAALGAANLVMGLSNLGKGEETIGAIALIFNFVLFILPGLAVAGIGAMIGRKSKSAKPVEVDVVADRASQSTPSQ